MISLQLRSTAPQNRMQMLKLIVEQLQGIGGSRSVGMGPKRVMSLPDAVAGALMKQYLSEEKVEQMTLFNGQRMAAPVRSCQRRDRDHAITTTSMSTNRLMPMTAATAT